MSYDGWKSSSPTDDLPSVEVEFGEEEPCRPGTHAWVIGRFVGEYCSECGWTRAQYELLTKDVSRDSLRRYPCIQ